LYTYRRTASAESIQFRFQAITGSRVTPEPIDTSDVERWMGKTIGGEQLRESVTITDMRRWVQAMHNPNPAHYDEKCRDSSGAWIAPQSLILACAIRHGVTPSMQGEILAGRQMNGGDEWWFGPRISIGDHVTSVRLAFDYRVTDTAFAGPTIFQRGDTTYVNQDGQVLAKQRSTAIRFLAANLKQKKPKQDEGSALPEFSAEMIAAFEQERLAYARALRETSPPVAGDISVGMQLPRRLVGPHSVQSFTTEQRAFLYTIWGNLSDDGLPRTERVFRSADAAIDPEFGDGLYHGASAGHTDSKSAALRGMPRAYGAGASVCAFIIDYAANWAGSTGWVEHCSIQYRSPVLVGDATYISGEVTGIEQAASGDHASVTLAINAANQAGIINTRGTVTVRLPLTT
jgi:N-terminal half of MaoC dehydratase